MHAIYRVYREYLSSCHVASRPVLVCMMSMCNRSKRVLSDILCVALVMYVPRTSRESFASTRARARWHEDQGSLWRAQPLPAVCLCVSP